MIKFFSASSKTLEKKKLNLKELNYLSFHENNQQARIINSLKSLNKQNCNLISFIISLVRRVT